MRAVVLDEYGGPEVLRIREIPGVKPGRGEVRAAVAAAGLNRADVMERMGSYPPPGAKPEFEIPGLEFSGTVDEVGEGVEDWKPGARVFGLLTLGGYAEQVVVHERMLMPVPAEMSLEQAAAVPEAYFTAWDALTDKGGLKAGETVLVHAGGSGVGTAAIQLARFLGAGRVFATTRTSSKAARLKGIGADRAIVTTHESFDEVVKAETEGRGADVVIDFIGGPYLERNLKAAALEGRLVCVAVLGGTDAPLALPRLMTKRLRVVGTSLRSRPLEQKILLTQQFARRVLPRFASGRIAPVLDRTFRLDEAAEAHRYMEANQNFGKVVLTVK